MSTIHPFHRSRPGRETLICLHASGSAARQWSGMGAALSASFQVVAPELLGYRDEPPWPAGTPVSLDDEAAALAPLLQGHGVHLLGHSYGAAVALQMALLWPGRVKSLTLYEPVRFAVLAHDRGSSAGFEDIVGVGRRIGQDVLAGATAAAAERFVDYWSGEGTWRQMPVRRQQGLAERMTKVRAEFEALFADRVPLSAYRALAMPVHLIGGTASPAPARQVLRLLAGQMPHARFTTLQGLGHMGPIDAPQRVLAALGLPAQDVFQPRAA